MALDKMLERYRSDAAFRSVVDIMRHAFASLSLAPSEMREAAMVAVWLEETRNPKPVLGVDSWTRHENVKP